MGLESAVQGEAPLVIEVLIQPSPVDCSNSR